ncbi:MAG: GDP-mannose 4,6-dehydratase [Methylocystis sp.]|nr:GDP-mannose 4,6-dehydratase [Methylocystis sp.]
MASYDRILLTGGTGFVGPYVARAVAGAYTAARRVILVRPGENNGDAAWTPIAADLVDEAAVASAVAACQPDLVIHLAAQASVAQSIGAAETTWRVNFQGSFNLAAALARHAPQTTMLFVSSADVYGLRLRDGAAKENTPICPVTAYAKSKAAAEGMLADILPEAARLIIVRPFNHTGPGQDRRFVLPSFAAQIAAIEQGRRPPRIEVGDLSIERDFLDVRDAVDAYMSLIEAGPRLESRCVFNVASGTSRSLASLLDALRQRATRPFEIVIDRHRLRTSEIPNAAGDATKLRDATGWRPRHSIDDTLISLLDHWRVIEKASPRCAFPEEA